MQKVWAGSHYRRASSADFLLLVWELVIYAKVNRHRKDIRATNGLCDLVHGELAPLSLPSLWLSPSGHHDPEDLGWLTLSTCIFCGLSFLVRKLVIYVKGDDTGEGLCGLVRGQLAPLSLPSLWLSPSGHHDPEDLGWPALSTCILCGLSRLVRELVIYVKGAAEAKAAAYDTACIIQPAAYTTASTVVGIMLLVALLTPRSVEGICFIVDADKIGADLAYGVCSNMVAAIKAGLKK
ncbi:uncharacterized protein [Dermacentor andersoni]|uniref:uncharacterized protein n=1 Tax=Dermacentor andersoni TaxID=34620 RepID=UPI003B3BD5CD